MSNQTIVKYKNLELLCKPNTVNKYRDRKTSVDQVLLSDVIYKSIKKGERVKDNDLLSIFNTTDMNECIKIMLDKGNYQISAEERKEKIEQKRREIIGYVSRNYVDSKNKLPIPITRIEAALETLKIKIDPDIPTNKQLDVILKKLPTVMPMKKQNGMNAELRVPHKYLGGTNNVIRKYGVIVSERYDSYGGIYEISLPANESEELFKDMTKLTKNDYKFEIIKM